MSAKKLRRDDFETELPLVAGGGLVVLARELVNGYRDARVRERR